MHVSTGINFNVNYFNCRFNNYMVFTLEVKYDDLGRIHQWRRKVGTSDLKAYEYVYDIGRPLILNWT